MGASLPSKWEWLRLAKIKRISGENPGGTGGTGTGTDPDVYTGKLRLVFTGQEENGTNEVSLFYADYEIDSTLTYQVVRIVVATSAEENNPIDPGEVETVDGFITFRTLDTEDEMVQDFLDLLAPPVGQVEGSNGRYPSPEVYQVMDNDASLMEFSLTSFTHGTGMLTLSAWNAISAINSDVNTWLTTFNYPFDLLANRESASPVGITIPQALFREFDIAVPAGDEPEGDISGTYYPVWVNRILREDATAQQISFIFATYRVLEPGSTAPIEFAKLTLDRDWAAGRVVSIEPLDDLYEETGTGAADWQQGFGRGHVVLSSKWGTSSNDEVDTFFDLFLSIISVPADATFLASATRLSSFARKDVPKYIPTIGEWEALKGTSAAKTDTPLDPSDDNRYVTELDQGQGDLVDFATSTALPEANRTHPSIDRYGYKGSLLSQKFRLIIDASDDTIDYTVDLLPRIRILLGRDPIFGDQWYDGTNWKVFNGDLWQTP